MKNLLPEIDFVLSMSAREFYRTDYDVDFIFSAVPLKTEKKVFVVNNFLSDQEKRQLRERVLRSTAIIQTEIVTPEKILAVVKKHAQVVDETSLYEELLSLFTPKESIILEKKRPHLIDLLKGETIQIFEDKVSWSEVLDALARPLERQQVITTDYIKALKKEMPILPAYTVLRHKIALPHTVAEAGAIGVGISLGLVKKGIITEDGRKIHTVILLGSNDKEEHLDLIFEMMSLAGADELAQLEKAATKEEIREALIHFNDEYWRAK